METESYRRRKSLKNEINRVMIRKRNPDAEYANEDRTG